MKQLPVIEGLFEGAVSFEKGDGWIKPWRIRFDRRCLFPGNYGPYLNPAGWPAGVRLRFSTNSTAVSVGLVPSREARPFDLTIDGELIQTALVRPNHDVAVFDNLPVGQKTIEIWLPQCYGAAISHLLIDDNAALETAADDRPKWITYGSSITHCMEAHSPARTWPAIVARDRNYNLTCLGYAGNCHMEPMIARMIRDLPADLISLKVGINVLGCESLSLRTFGAALLGFVKIIREKHPDIPIAVISPIISRPHEITTNKVGINLTIMRQQIRAAVERLEEYGDTNLHYLDGRDLLGFEEKAAFIADDEVHPTADGYEQIGKNFLEAISKKQIFPGKGH